MISIFEGWTIFVIILFFLLTPGVLLSLPSKASIVTKAFVHAIIFGIIYYIAHIFMLHIFGIY
jgi:hypothetical protein